MGVRGGSSNAQERLISQSNQRCSDRVVDSTYFLRYYETATQAIAYYCMPTQLLLTVCFFLTGRSTFEFQAG